MKCEKSRHMMLETVSDVACCNCCEEGEFFDPIEDDPFYQDDPYVVTNPMAFY